MTNAPPIGAHESNTLPEKKRKWLPKKKHVSCIFRGYNNITNPYLEGFFSPCMFPWLFGGSEVESENDTPWKTNMSPENQWLEDVFPIEIVPF